MTAGSIPAELATACADVVAAADADQIAGVQARYVAAPASTDEASALLRAAAGLGLTLVPRGTGRRQHWGAPPASCDVIVDTRRLDQVLEHVAGDQVLRVQAGVPIDDLAKVVASAGQRLSLDPPSGGCIGGVLATNAAGPLRYRYGAPRDLLIGITVVRADGTVARSGGKVVKNVAGYDIGKLFAGSYGTLGLITEATFRLHPMPEQSAWLALDAADPAAAAAAVRAIADSPLTPSALELSWPAADQPLTVSVLLDGDESSVGVRTDRMRALVERGLAGRQPDHNLHPTLAADGTYIRVGFWTGQLAKVLTTIRTAAVANELDPAIHGSAGAGVLHVTIPADAGADAVVRFIAELRAGLAGLAAGSVVPSTASAVVLYAPRNVQDEVDLWGPVPSLGLMQAVKDQFDPQGRMAPGRFAGGM
ncbi:MAG TPA: FAD-binding oxidoreductase [Streptosporangiaceae bacterium]